MPDHGTIQLDALIIGGGAAGLWTLDALARRGDAVLLLEAHTLGSGQTVASQGIIHGGLKYTLTGLLNASARAVRDMPARWRESLAGQADPNLADTAIRSQTCYLWQTADLRSRAGMIGAKAGLRVAPTTVAPADRPTALANCPGQVAEMAEQVIDPASFVQALAETHSKRLLRVDPDGIEFDDLSEDRPSVRIRCDEHTMTLQPRTIVLTAGAGNGDLRQSMGLPAEMQRRPLHMTIARGDLPWLQGHCVDGAHTRVTITSAHDVAGRTVWQIGGQVAEDGVGMDSPRLIAHVQNELNEVLPGVSFEGIEWSTYRVDRAEPATEGKRRPDDAFVRRNGNIITAWPTKLAMVPRLADLVCERIETPKLAQSLALEAFTAWPRPAVARPPWENTPSWTLNSSDKPISS